MLIVAQEFEMASHTTSPIRVGQVLEIGFPTFRPRITIRSERELTVEIVPATILVSPTRSSTGQSRFAMAWSISHGRNTSEARSFTCLILVPATHTPR